MSQNVHEMRASFKMDPMSYASEKEKSHALELPYNF
jgi:hypothetical protein